MENLKDQALMHAISEQKKQDPLIGLKIGSKELVSRLQTALAKKAGRVHVESLLAIIGSLGGYSCHAAVRECLVTTGKMEENKAFLIVNCVDGKQYYFGDLVNQPLAQDKLSFWTLIGGEAQYLGAKELPDLISIFKRVADTVGGEKFGVISIPPQHQPSEKPLTYVRSLWEQICGIIDKFCDSPAERPILFGLAAQHILTIGKDVIDPQIAATILMECAVPMSKIGPEWLEK